MKKQKYYITTFLKHCIATRRKTCGSEMAQIYLAINDWAWVRYGELYRSKTAEGVIQPRTKAEVDNTLQDLNDSPYPTEAEFINWFIIHSK